MINKRKLIWSIPFVLAAPAIVRAQSLMELGAGSVSKSGGTGLLLDTLSVPAIIAVSTRKLRTAYAGSSLRVQRSSDSTQQDIGFVSGNLDTASMATFVGANNGLVATFYDQSGNANNMTAVSAGAGPRVTNAGTNVTQNGHVACQTTIVLANSLQFTVSQAQPLTICICEKLANLTGVGTAHFMDGQSTTRVLLGAAAGPLYQIYAGGSPATGGVPDTNCHSLFGIYDDAHTNSKLIVDASTVIAATTVGTNSLGNEAYMAAFSGGATFDANYMEFLAFASVLGAGDISLIHSSWQTYWAST